MNRVQRIVSTGATVFLVLALLLAGWVAYLVRAPMPLVHGKIDVAGISSPVEVYRDDWGVPHIYADTQHDLFFAQGYVHAQDRFWQMEFWRRIGSGRLSEVFGEATLGTDRFVRTQGWNRIAQQEVELMDDDSRAILQAYADGVNAYISAHDRLGLEFALLGLQGVRYTPEPWTIVNTLTWAKAMAWDLSANMDSELERVALMQAVGVKGMQELLPTYPQNHPVIVPNGLAYEALDVGALRADEARLRSALDADGAGLGSNSWAIAGNRTDTGKPYLANDPHLGIQMPSIWYEVGLHCNEMSAACLYDVTGFSFAGAPGVIIGHNNRIAWGFTNLGPDVQDLYIERINPDNPNQYEVNGRWVDAEVINEVIFVRGRVEDPELPTGVFDENTGLTTVVIPVRITRHGPIINDINKQARGLSGDVGGFDLPADFGVALRWTALEPSSTFQAILRMNRSQTWDEFRAAARSFSVPSQNLVYADVDGNIGYQSPGNIPVRASGDGLLPVPGWVDDFEWLGYISFDDLPSSFNPPEGYVVTANNAVVGPDYPALLSLEWDRGYRAQRIVDMINAQRGPFSREVIAQMQGDNMNLSAQAIVPFLATLPVEDEGARAARDMLLDWDFQQSMDSAPAAFFNVFWTELLAATFYDELPPDLRPHNNDVTKLAVEQLLPQASNHWWDNVTTPDVTETRDQILVHALSQAYAQTVARLGGDMQAWQWGKLHTATFRNATLGSSGIAPIEALFNRGPVPTSGGEDIVNATGWDIAGPDDEVDVTYQVNWVPSMRMIVDLASLNDSWAIHTTGQSGHPFHRHYADMVDSWRLIEYHPQLWDRAAVEAAAAAHMTLTPRE